MKTQILLSSLLAIALTLTNSNIALSQQNTTAENNCRQCSTEGGNVCCPT